MSVQMEILSVLFFCPPRAKQGTLQGHLKRPCPSRCLCPSICPHFLPGKSLVSSYSCAQWHKLNLKEPASTESLHFPGVIDFPTPFTHQSWGRTFLAEYGPPLQKKKKRQVFCSELIFVNVLKIQSLQ